MPRTLSHHSEQMSGNSGFLKKTANPACLAGSRRRDVAAMATRLPEPSYVFTLVDRGVRKRGCPQAYFNGNKIVDVCSRQGWEDDMPVRNPRQHDVWTAETPMNLSRTLEPAGGARVHRVAGAGCKFALARCWLRHRTTGTAADSRKSRRRGLRASM